MRELAKRFYSYILQILLPQYCAGCGKEREIICEECLLRARKCEENLGEDNLALFSFKDKAIKGAIRSLKYKKALSVSPCFANAVYDFILEEMSRVSEMENIQSGEKILLIPVPLHKNRLAKRGFNQAEEICKEIARSDRGACFELKTDILLRIKDTESQVSVMERGKRLKNLNGAFETDGKKEVHGRTVLLLDDVITTGATVEECRKTLKKAGVKKVIAVAIAH